MTDAEFAELRRILREACGVALDDGKRYLIEGRMGPVLRRLEIASLSEFAARVAAQPYGPLRAELVDALVTTESSFFRDLHPWETLATTIVPRLLERRAAERRLTFWCAATASGQEPYSLAMLLLDRFPEVVSTWKIGILATDISRPMLDRAAAGRFSQLEVNRGLPAATLLKRFRQDGLHWQLHDDVRRMIEFRPLNLCLPWPAMNACDVIFLRNVMIYFTPEDKKLILARAARVLRPDGFLLLGGAETVLNLDSNFERAPELKGGFYRLTGAKA